MIKDEHIHITVIWDSQGHTVLKIRKDIAELNDQGCFFLEEGLVPVGKIQTFPDRYLNAVPTLQQRAM